MLMEKLLRLGKRQLHTIVSREIIKPSSPTPSHRNPYNLSPIDLLAQPTFVPVILFFPNSDNRNLSAHDKARVLKESLSHSLTRYYPLSGRLPTPTTPYVDCNDEGVSFVEARNEHRLETFRHLNVDDETFHQLFPDDRVFNSQSTNLMGIQLNHFACGGIGLAVSLSHLICDGGTIGSFLSHWASVARYGSTDHKEVQPFNPHILCHPAATSSLPESLSWHVKGDANRVTKKFLFPNSKLNELKNKVISLTAVGSTQPINNPTRIEVLTSLLYTSAVAAATKNFGSFKPSYLFMPINIRNSFVQKLPQTTMGNFVSLLSVPTMDASDVSLSMLVSGIKKEKMQLKGIQSVQQAADNMRILQSRLTDVNVIKSSYWCTSLCRFFPCDKMDFGWGKPTGATFSLRSADCNGFLLMDTPDGDGIEAKAVLEKEEMEIFENETEILSNCL